MTSRFVLSRHPRAGRPAGKGVSVPWLRPRRSRCSVRRGIFFFRASWVAALALCRRGRSITSESFGSLPHAVACSRGPVSIVIGDVRSRLPVSVGLGESPQCSGGRVARTRQRAAPAAAVGKGGWIGIGGGGERPHARRTTGRGRSERALRRATHQTLAYASGSASSGEAGSEAAINTWGRPAAGRELKKGGGGVGISGHLHLHGCCICTVPARSRGLAWPAPAPGRCSSSSTPGSTWRVVALCWLLDPKLTDVLDTAATFRLRAPAWQHGR